MFVKKNSLNIIQDFLIENHIDIDVEHYLKKYIVVFSDLKELPDDIIQRIISDAYGFSDNLVKDISYYLQKKFNLILGRIQKNQLKKYIDYRFEDDCDIFLKLIKHDFGENINLKEVIDSLIEKSGYSVNKELSIYINNLKNSIRSKDNNRVQDYLIFLYSRLLSLNEKSKISLLEIFSDNVKIIKKELSSFDFERLKNLCKNSKKIQRAKAISQFNSIYSNILEKNGNYKQKNAIIYIYLNQKLFDKFDKKELFYNYLFNVISKAHQEIQNHKTLIIHVGNILCKNINIKWEIYAYVSIFAEKFLSIEEKRIYYKPHEICIDVLEYKYNLKLSKLEKQLIEHYYLKESTEDDLKSIQKFRSKDFENIVNFFKKINVGFTFRDAFVLIRDEKINNSKEIEFIKNCYDLLLIFNKHQIDDRRIPCPVCGSLQISGNSYPEIGIRSWECKNPLCSERSKTNRGKRFSERTIFMQNSAFDFSKENLIDKKLVHKWRKDVVEKWDYNDLYHMIVKFFSFIGDSIHIINASDEELFKQIIKSEKRNSVVSIFSEFLKNTEIDKHLFDKFQRNVFFNMFFYENMIKSNYTKKISEFIKDKDEKKIRIIRGDAYEILDNMAKNSMYVHNMITSPPYYNAREYSQWSNLYNYLNKMYNIIIKANDVLINGGVFFYNIGDIFDNENIIVKSKMGEKRIPLGAYTILSFLRADFELLDNIIWYKGEPQSNRHKNDGNYVPYYQRPANCYEHMFIFKKKGKLRLNKVKQQNILNSNIISFNPVVKIGADRENKYGHTAPFPEIIPKLSICCFTNHGEFVLDPFSGSGTTPHTASLLGRIGIGIEKNEKYAKLSCSKTKEKLLDYVLI